jgi:hypothetical protein
MVDRVTHMINIQSTALDLFAKKNADYGDAFAKYGIIGVLIRIQDKIQRALTITTNNIHLTEDESIRDTMLDLHNYAAMALMLMEEGKAERYIATESDSDNTSQTIDFTDSEECGEEFESDIGNNPQYYYENQLNNIEYDDDYGLSV